MSKARYEELEFWAGRWYVKSTGQRATPSQIRAWDNRDNEPSVKSRIKRNRTAFLNTQYKKYFSRGTKFVSAQGHVAQWARSLNLRGGKNPNFNWQNPKYKDFSGRIVGGSSKLRFGANVSRTSKSNPGAGQVIDGVKGWLKHIYMVNHQIGIQTEHFRVMAGQRALRIFQNSFKYQKFYSKISKPWSLLAPYTINKRAKRGTGRRILKEYGDLYNSLKMSVSNRSGIVGIETEVVRANPAHHKAHSICYAGYHNEGVGTYGRYRGRFHSKRYIKRQFIGHSSYMNPITDPFMKKMLKLYLFDSVFLTRKV